METLTETTLYPKITNHIKEVVKALKWSHRDPSNPEKEVILPSIPIVGTVKLHGTHVDILVYQDNTIVLQSRNNANLMTTADNQGFANAMTKKRGAILSLRNRYHARWRELHPGEPIDMSVPITIAGEWIGEKIQKGVALVRLSKRLVIISVKINGKWVPDADYPNIEEPKEGIYNISRGGFYYSTLYPQDQQCTNDNLEKLAERVAAQCPFAESFGVIGEGEGLVWKLVPHIDQSELWFKTKGGKFKPTFTSAPKKLSADDAGKRQAAATVAKAWCSEQRMEQGWDYLREQSIPQNLKGIGAFLKWVQQDILLEEVGYIEEHMIHEQMLRMEIIAIAKPWFQERYKKEDE
ncbi:uncharacterized protein BDR25DRAFT_100281 [Lindgomyces ingoldianus]|uniref:Uncharacterized protein n=1 Tax=Lindgomyces ingoldianus TaxID=673940 RepID=A0ACB6R8P9_9PLEO|nr:uncharacterized protein BDR25DRAFT_100281 [Lindgomyces ingoldianus]KAF2475148.1 hypothetical protein BDR25DRAFT_100281 [Lindgomyces ingoldianus]